MQLNKYFFLSLLWANFLFPIPPEVQKIEQIIGIKGDWFDQESVFKISSPRTDLIVQVDGWKLPPFMGLSSWVSFSFKEENVIAMGDLVLFEDEVNPAIDVALEKGLLITAMHNHFFYDHPRVIFMHIEGMGAPESIADAVKAILNKIKEIRSYNRSVSKSFAYRRLPEKSSITQKMIDELFQVKSSSQKGMVKIVIGRQTQMGQTLGKEMGINSWAAFAGSDDNAVVDGDIAVLEDELQDVLAILRKADINIVAIHNHMIHESPRILFLHYWGYGPVEKLAGAIKRATAP